MAALGKSKAIRTPTLRTPRAFSAESLEMTALGKSKVKVHTLAHPLRTPRAFPAGSSEMTALCKSKVKVHTLAHSLRTPCAFPAKVRR